MNKRKSIRDGIYEPVFFNIATTGLNPTRDKILTIILRYRGKNIIFKEWDKGEKEIIEQFYDFTTLEIKRKYTKFVGFNILEFDVLFLLERLHHQGYDETEFEKRWERFARHLSFIDLRQLLGDSFGNFAKWKFGFAADWFDISGDMIPKLYGKGEYTAIERYVNAELQQIEQMYDEIKKEPFYHHLLRLRDLLDKKYTDYRKF